MEANRQDACPQTQKTPQEIAHLQVGGRRDIAPGRRRSSQNTAATLLERLQSKHLAERPARQSALGSASAQTTRPSLLPVGFIPAKPSRRIPNSVAPQRRCAAPWRSPFGKPYGLASSVSAHGARSPLPCADCLALQSRIDELERRLGLREDTAALARLIEAFGLTLGQARILHKLSLATDGPIPSSVLLTELPISNRNSLKSLVKQLRRNIGQDRIRTVGRLGYALSAAARREVERTLQIA